MKIPEKLSGFAVSMFSFCLASSVLAAELNLYATMPDKYASEVLAQFSKDTGIKVNYLRLSAGEVLARVQAEKIILRWMQSWEALPIFMRRPKKKIS